MKIVITEVISEENRAQLIQAGFEVKEIQIAYEQLAAYTQKNQTDVLWLAQTGMLDEALLKTLGHLRVLILGGTRIELEWLDSAQEMGLQVLWAENALSNATAEMALAHLLNGCRLLPESNRNMPLEGDTSFKFLQESYSNGLELSGKTLGLIGVNVAGLKLAQKALGLGMEVVYCDPKQSEIDMQMELPNGISFPIALRAHTKEEVLEQAHFISLHSSRKDRYALAAADFTQAKKLLGLINCAYPEAVNEVDLVEEINKETLLFAGLDRFEEEPHPAVQVLMQPAFSLSPFIHSTTQESVAAVLPELMEKILVLKK